MTPFTPIEYLKIDIATTFGLTDAKWHERLDWFEANEAVLEDLTQEADEKAQYLAGVMAYRDVMQGKPTGFQCGLDATASGLQILSVLSGCKKSASTCNLVNTGNRENAYKAVYKRMQESLPTGREISYKDLKGALMTHLYGSKAVPERVFGKGTEELALFYATVDELMPGANQLNTELIGLWNPEALSHDWTMPDGFDVQIKVLDTIQHEVIMFGQTYKVNEVVNRAMDRGLSLGANICHSVDGMVVREMNRRCNYDPKKINEIMEALGQAGGTSTMRAKDLQLLRLIELAQQSDFVSAVFFEYIDVYNSGHLPDDLVRKLQYLIADMPAAPFPVLCVHDCFKFHPNHGNAVRQQYINIYAELAESRIMDSIATHLRGTEIRAKKLDLDLADEIRKSEYVIC